MLNLSFRNILICLIYYVPTFCLAQTSYDGQVIDKVTEDPIKGVNVSLIKEKTGTQTNERGYFELSSEKPLPDDTLQFSFIGYKTFKLPVSAYQSQIFIMLEASSTQLKEVHIANKKKLKDIVIDKFGWYDLKDFQGVGNGHNAEVVKSQTTVAKFFAVPNVNAKLIKISLGRQDLHSSPTYSIRIKFTTFLIHIMTPDTITGLPGKIIFTKTVALNDNSLWVDIDFAKDKLVIPTKTFFVAVEWIITPYNEIIGVNNAPKVAKTTRHGYQVLKDASEYYVYYQPFLIGYNPQDDTRKRALLYFKNNNQWRIFRHQTAELALSATIRY